MKNSHKILVLFWGGGGGGGMLKPENFEIRYFRVAKIHFPVSELSKCSVHITWHFLRILFSTPRVPKASLAVY